MTAYGARLRKKRKLYKASRRRIVANFKWVIYVWTRIPYFVHSNPKLNYMTYIK